MRNSRVASVFAALAAALLLGTWLGARSATAHPLSTTDAPSAVGEGGGTVYGLFVAIDDYGGENRSLPYDVRSARALAQAFAERGLIRPGNAVMLTDRAATREGVRRALAELAPRVTAADTLVFFFNGHGDAHSLELRHGTLQASELARLLDPIEGAQLLVIDSCGSGGFASIVGRSPRRVGFFSARAGETSYDATPYAMGGWLSQFMLEALRGGVPAGPDGAVHFASLARYLAARYDATVTRQHLVVRAPSDLALFRAPAARAPTLPVAPGDDGDDADDTPPAPSVVAIAPRVPTAPTIAPRPPALVTVTSTGVTVDVSALVAQAQRTAAAQMAGAQEQMAAAQARVAAAQAQIAALRAGVLQLVPATPQ